MLCSCTKVVLTYTGLKKTHRPFVCTAQALCGYSMHCIHTLKTFAIFTRRAAVTTSIFSSQNHAAALKADGGGVFGRVGVVSSRVGLPSGCIV